MKCLTSVVEYSCLGIEPTTFGRLFRRFLKALSDIFFFSQNDTDEDLSDVFQGLLTNEILFTTLPGIRASLERCPVLTNDVEFMEIYTRALAVKDSLIVSVDFLKEVRLKVSF